MNNFGYHPPIIPEDPFQNRERGLIPRGFLRGGMRYPEMHRPLQNNY